MGERGLDKFITFMFVYILIVFPLTLFTEEELFPFSRYPMYSHNTLNPCGHIIFLSENNQAVILDRYRWANVFLKNYAPGTIDKRAATTPQMCQFIREVFWPKNFPHNSFYVKKYCTNVKELPSLKFSDQIVLVCH